MANKRGSSASRVISAKSKSAKIQDPIVKKIKNSSPGKRSSSKEPDIKPKVAGRKPIPGQKTKKDSSIREIHPRHGWEAAGTGKKSLDIWKKQSSKRQVKDKAAKISKKKDRHAKPLQKIENFYENEIKTLEGRPLGIRVLINYTLILAAFYMLMAIFTDMGIFFGLVTGKAATTMINLVMAILLMIVAYGFFAKRYWLYLLSLALYALFAANAFISMIALSANISHALSPIKSFIIPSLLVSLFLNILTFWYVMLRRDHFTDNDNSAMELPDTVFVSAIYLFYFFMFIFVILSLFTFFYSAKATIDDVMPLLAGKDPAGSIDVCNQLSDEERDICLLASVVVHSEEDIMGMLCEDIGSDFYRFTCRRAAG